MLATTTDLSSTSTEELQQQITTLAAQINAATYRLLALIAEFDRRSGWAGVGLRSCAHWLNWQIGIDLRAAREKVRVARAIEGLPRIREAFAKGVVSYSKVRAMTRVARPDNEEDLLHIALNGTASHVEKLVRLYRSTKAGAERDAAMALWRERYLVTYFDEDGALVIRGKLPPDEGAVLMRALQAARDELRAGSAEQSAHSNTSEAAASDPASSAVPRCSAEHQHAAADVPQPSFEQLNADALVQLARSGAQCEVVVHVDAEVLSDPGAEGTSALEDGPALCADTVRRLACDAGIVPLVHGPSGEPLAIGRRARKIPAPMRRALHARDRGCRFPGCTVTDRRYVDGHHIRHWANGGPTNLDNLVELCRHHHRLIHEGGVALERLTDGTIRVTPPRDGPLAASKTLPECYASEIDWWHERIDPMPRWRGENMDYDQAVGHLQWRDIKRMGSRATGPR